VARNGRIGNAVSAVRGLGQILAALAMKPAQAEPAASADSGLTVMLNGTEVSYRLVRVRRRTIGMVIDDDGLTVRAPPRASKRDIAQALADHADWIIRTLVKWAKREKRPPPQEWRDGASVLYRGEPLLLLVQAGRQTRTEHDLFALHVRLRSVGPEEIAAAVERWLQLRAREIFRERLDFYSGLLGLAPPIFKLTRARTQWGSCNAKGVIRLNWRLIHLPPALANYVIAHEIAHRVELNHSPRFWATVERISPDCKQARRELDRHGGLLD
jgi:predicted metal-dependent hydrolase